MTTDLLDALERGSLTEEQLRELIASEARQLGLTFEEAVSRARSGTLPRNVLGIDLRLLICLLDREPRST